MIVQFQQFPKVAKKLAILIVKSDIVYKSILINFTLHIS